MNLLSLPAAEAKPAEPANPRSGAPPLIRDGVPVKRGAKILRFARSERLLHWAIAAPFLICYWSALILVVFYNPHPTRPFRLFFSVLHRTSGSCLILLPLLVAYRSRGDFRLHLYNVKQAWSWAIDDIKWLFLMGANAINPKVKLPDQGKFNAAEKVNFMVLMGTYPLYVMTGLLIWLTDCAFVSWLLHTAMALLATPLILGHMYMAIISKSGRPGLTGMKDGYVDKHWARHHYGHWYREHFGAHDHEEEHDEEHAPDVESPKTEGGEGEEPVRLEG